MLLSWLLADDWVVRPPFVKALDYIETLKGAVVDSQVECLTNSHNRQYVVAHV